MERILISGGNGFLGRYLIKKILENGYLVTVVDNLSTSKKVTLPKEVHFINSSIEDFSTDETYEYVIHLAARPSPEDYIQNPVKTLTSNSIGTIKMLEIARKSNATFMYTSSSEIYGDAEIIPTSETYFGYVNSVGQRSCYDEGKRFSEALIMAYHKEYVMDTRIQRPFNVYGPGIREDGSYGRVIHRFIMQALNGDPITIHGTGDQTRSFLFVDDWVEASWRLLLRDGLKGEIINIGSEKEVSIRNLADKIIKKTNSSSNILFTGTRSDDPNRRAANINKAYRLLNWEPKIELDVGLDITIKWFKRGME